MSKIDSKVLKDVLSGAYANLENNKQLVNNLNVFPVPDGDTGTNMALTVKTAIEELSKADIKSATSIADAMANGALMGARGNSGVILSQLFRGFAKGVKEGDGESGVQTVAAAFDNAAKMAYRAVMKPTEGTILTVAREMSEYAVEHVDEFDSVTDFLKQLLKVGEVSLDNTPNLLPVLKEAGVVDAGGKGLLCLVEGGIKVLEGEEIVFIEADVIEDDSAMVDTSGLAPEDIEFGFCTEFLIKANKGTEKYQDALRGALKDKLSPLGDSLLVVGSDGIIKVHVHTNEPWNAMKMAAACGELSKIKIENMREQHSEILLKEELEDEQKKTEKYSDEEKKYVIIGVAAGSGMVDILTDLGVDYVIEGGQTMNPSAGDFKEIIDNTNGDNYILLPNNKNIILAAKQAQEMSEKNISVVETRTIPEAISAMMGFDENASAEDNADDMREAMEEVKTGQVTYAVRDTENGDMKIKEGDILGIAGSDIVCANKKIEKCALDLVDKMVDEDSELISIYYGEDTKEEDAKQLAEKIEEKYPDFDIEISDGGQPLYYYIVSVE